MGLYVELENFNIEALRPPASQDVDELALSHCRCVREGEEEFGREHGPFIHLWIVDLNRGESLLSIVATEDIYATVTDDRCECATGRIQGTDGPPFFIEDIVCLTARHAFVLAVVATDNVDLSIEVDTGVFLPCKIHGFSFL